MALYAPPRRLPINSQFNLSDWMADENEDITLQEANVNYIKK